MVLLDVVIPEGCGGDDSFAVHAPDGTLLDIQVPKGYAAGDVLTVEHCEAAVTVETVSVCIPDELVAGELFSVETSHGTFDVAVPPGCSGGMLIEVDLPTDPPPAPSPPTSDAWQSVRSESGHRYRAGQCVQVLRSDGSYSRGTVVSSFEGVFDVLYEIRLAGGQLKAAVPEEEMFAADDADDANFGDHFAAAMAAAMEAEMSEASFGQVLMSD